MSKKKQMAKIQKILDLVTKQQKVDFLVFECDDLEFDEELGISIGDGIGDGEWRLVIYAGSAADVLALASSMLEGGSKYEQAKILAKSVKGRK